MTYKENEHYREIELFNDDGVKVGEAEVDTKGQMLSRLTIFEPYRNKGYGERAVTELTYMYDLRELWVNADNFIAIHTYERCGYCKAEPPQYKCEKYGCIVCVTDICKGGSKKLKVYLNEVTGMDDALVSMYMSKRTWTPELDERIRNDWWRCYYGGEPDNEEEWQKSRKETANRIRAFLKYAWAHTTMLDFITVSATVQGIHRAGQDDWDAHACRFNNRIIRASTRLADFAEGEMSDFYKGKIIPTDVAIEEIMNSHLPNAIQKDGHCYVKTVNGYIRDDLKDNRDVKRGLYMESIPSDFIFKVNMAQWAHVYRLRKKGGTANTEVQQLAEMLQDEIENDMPWFNREYLAKVQI